MARDLGQRGTSSAYTVWLAAMADPTNRADAAPAERFECWLMFGQLSYSDYREFPHSRRARAAGGPLLPKWWDGAEPGQHYERRRRAA